MLAKLDIENKVALRESVINVVVNNGYFFNGMSIPHNKELMRIYRGWELVKSLDSRIPRILRAYGEECFRFTNNFIRITFPITAHGAAHDAAHDVDNVSEHVKTLVSNIDGEVDRETLQSTLGIKHRTYFRNTYLKPSMDKGYIEFTLPNEKQSKLQKYRLTAKGLALKENLKNSK